MILEEDEINLNILEIFLEECNCEISGLDVESNSFTVILNDQCAVLLSINPSKKVIKLTRINDLIKYDEDAEQIFLSMINNANKSTANVTSYLFIHQETFYLVVNQYISYSCGLILEQFGELLGLFGETSTHIRKHYITPAYKMIELNRLNKSY